MGGDTSKPLQRKGSALASPIERFAAALADLGVLIAADLVLFYCLLAALPPDEVVRAFPLIAAFCSLAYLVLLWGRGQTFGKRLLAIKIVGPDGERPGLSRGALRFAGYVIASLPFKIGLLPILWDPLRRGWHDHIAGTMVVKENAGVVPAPPSLAPALVRDSAPGSICWRDLAMLPVFAAATVLLTWPVVARLPSRFPSDGGDANLFVWNLWWFRKAALDPRLSLFNTDYIYWPGHVSTRLHSFSIFNGLLGIPLQAFLSPTLAYSVLLLLALCFTAFAAYLLGKYVTGSVTGGLLVGLFFGFCPYMIWHAHGHLDLVSDEWAVIYVLLMVIVLKKAQARHALAAAFALALAGLCAWHHLTHLGLFTAVFPAAWLAAYRKGTARRALLIAAAGLLGLALLAAWLVPMVREFASGRYEYDEVTARARADAVSLDAASLFVPPPYHPLFGRWTSKVYYEGLLPRAGTEQAGYVGWSVMALALAGVWDRRRRRAHLPWMAAAAAFVLLSLGFDLHFFGRSGLPVWLLLAAGGPPGSGLGLPVVPSLATGLAAGIASGAPHFLQSQQRVDLPFTWLWQVGGVMRLASTPARFVQMANLCLAVLASLGALHLARVVGARRGKWAGRAVAALAAGAVMFEYLIAPHFPTERAAMHPFYSRLARDRSCIAIVDVWPKRLADTHAQRAQTIHGKRLYGGFMSRTPDHASDFLAHHPLLSEALEMAPSWMPTPRPLHISLSNDEPITPRALSIYRADLSALARTGCSYVLVHKWGSKPASLRRARQLLAGGLHLPVALDDDRLTVYELPRDSERGAASGSQPVLSGRPRQHARGGG